MTRFALPLIFLALPARADDAAIAALLDAAMAEQRVIQTCTALIPDSGPRLQDFWQEEVAETLTLIAETGAAPDNLAVFAASALPGALLPRPDTPWSEVAAMCAADPEWYRRFQRFEMIHLPRAIGDLQE